MGYVHQDIENNLTYKGYTTSLTLIVDENIVVGKLKNIPDTITFKAEHVSDIMSEFKQAVDEYLQACAEVGRVVQEQGQTLPVWRELVRSFRKKPVVIQACQFIYAPENIKTLQDFCGDALGYISKARHPGAKAEAQLKTLEDGKYTRVVHVATEGDWIIKGVQGEFYACKPDIFEATYEEVQP